MSRCLVYMAAAAFAASIPAQATPVDPHPAITTSAGPNNTCTMTWPGQAGYTYFIQITADPVNGPWEFAPFIEYGTGADISWGFCSAEPAFFVRLLYTDQPVPGGDPEAADFDGDGVSNGIEIFQQAGSPVQSDSDGDGLSDGQERTGGTDPLVLDMPEITIQRRWRHGDSWKSATNQNSRVGSTSITSNTSVYPYTDTSFTPATEAPAAMNLLVNPGFGLIPWANLQPLQELKAHIHYCLAPLNYTVFGNAVTQNTGTADCTEFETRIIPSRKVRFEVRKKFLQVQRSKTGTGAWVLEALPAGSSSQVILTAPPMTPQQQQNQNQQPLPSPAWTRGIPAALPGLAQPIQANYFRREILLHQVELYDERRHTDITGAPPAPNAGDQRYVDAGAFIAEGAMAGIAAHQPGADLNPQATDASDAPAMPQLVARIAGNEQGNTLTARWRLRVNYVRGNGQRPAFPSPATDTVVVPAAVSATPEWTTPILFSSEWAMFQNSAWINEVTQNGFFGGAAELYCWVTGQTEPTQPFLRFTIGGLNPDDQRCRHYIDQQAPLEAQARATLTNQGLGQNPIAVGTGLWFAYAIAKSETKDYNNRGLNQNTRYNHFWEVPRHGGRARTKGQPLWGGDRTGPGGYGLFQVTGNISASTVIIPRREIWNWQDNVRAGLQIVAYKKYGPDEIHSRYGRRHGDRL